MADSSGLMSGRLLIFGGRADPDADGSGGPYLNDLWELNPGKERYKHHDSVGLLMILS